MSDLFEYYIESENFHFKYAKGEPSLKGEEFHNYNEFVYFMDGEADFISKNIVHTLKPGSVIIIPKHHFHQFNVTSPHKYSRCILGFRQTEELGELSDAVMTETRIFETPNKKILAAFEALKEIISGNFSEEEKRLFVSSSLTQLLIHTKKFSTDALERTSSLSPLVSRALDYIDANFSENLSIEHIASRLFVSPSTLSHRFSKEINMSVYKYISKKRLSMVQNYIDMGESKMTAAEKCGFGDYSNFYRMYKKYYNK